MGLATSALMLLGIGIISSRFKAGIGLGELGAGIQALVAAPLSGTGLGLSTAATGIRDIAMSFGDIGRGLSDLFASIPKLPTIPGGGLPGPNQGQLPPPTPPALPGWGGGGGGVRSLLLPVPPPVVKAGGGSSDLLPGGGGTTPIPIPAPVPRPPSAPPRIPYYLARPVSMTTPLRPVMM